MWREAVRISVSFCSRADSLNAVLPPGFRLDGKPVARLEAT
jgi:hypothetical protein